MFASQRHQTICFLLMFAFARICFNTCSTFGNCPFFFVFCYYIFCYFARYLKHLAIFRDVGNGKEANCVFVCTNFFALPVYFVNSTFGLSVILFFLSIIVLLLFIWSAQLSFSSWSTYTGELGQCIKFDAFPVYFIVNTFRHFQLFSLFSSIAPCSLCMASIDLFSVNVNRSVWPECVW